MNFGGDGLWIFTLFSWLVSQPASSAFLLHQISISYQLAACQHYFSLTTNHHQLPVTVSQITTCLNAPVLVLVFVMCVFSTPYLQHLSLTPLQ